jgi:hypothetical protein
MTNSPAFLTHLQNVHSAAKNDFQEKHLAASQFLLEKKIDLGQIRDHSTRLLTAGTLAGTMLLSSPDILSLPQPVLPHQIVAKLAIAGVALPQDPRAFLVEEIKKILPQKVSLLSYEQEKEIARMIEKLTGIKTRASLEGEKLNQSYGLIGAEQHLPRFPGDTITQHDEYQKSGITPGRGAWGYFAQSQQSLTPQEIQMEKYYVAVQTLYLSDFNKRFGFLRDWYKYRKVIVVNPVNGKADVAIIGDAGPASWTGKHFGGSPEVMADLELNRGMQKGPVLLFFVDDPDNKVPLGPVDYNKLNLPIVKESEV